MIVTTAVHFTMSYSDTRAQTPVSAMAPCDPLRIIDCTLSSVGSEKNNLDDGTLTRVGQHNFRTILRNLMSRKKDEDGVLVYVKQFFKNESNFYVGFKASQRLS